MQKDEFECEIRFLINDIKTFMKKLNSLGAEVLSSYKFSDHYFKPKNFSPWDPISKSIRIRHHFIPRKESEILFSKVKIIKKNGFSFKKSIYPEGKIKIFKGSFETCKRLLSDLGFEEWFIIHKEDCKVLRIPNYNFEVAIEKIKNLGWIGEFEVKGKDTEKIVEKMKKYLSLLSIKEKDVFSEPLAKFYLTKVQEKFK